jgi:hypothetical protein
MVDAAPVLNSRRDKFLVPIDLGGGRNSVVQVNGDQVDRFNILGAVAGAGDGTTEIQPQIVTRRGGGTRYIYNGANDTSPESRVQSSSRSVRVRTIENKFKKGKEIKVPLGLRTPNGNERFTTFHFPAAASHYVIAVFIKTKFRANKPSYFLTPSGARHPVNVAVLPDLNPRDTGDGDPAPAPAAP